VKRSTLSLILGLALTAPIGARAAEYYFDSARGSDENAGNTPAAPLKSLKKLASLGLDPGDTVHFRRGGVWRGQLQFKGNGLEGAPIRLTAYGNGPKPEFLGSQRLSGWELHEGQIYKVKVPRKRIIGDKEINAVFVCPKGKVPTVIRRRRSGLPSKPGQCFYDKEEETLYLITPDGKPPSAHILEVPVLSPTLSLKDRAWLEIDNLAFAFGNRTQVTFHGCRDVLFRDCAVVFMGGKNPNVGVSKESKRVHIADCFVYWSANNGIKFNAGSTRCKVTGCTIVKLSSNDGICVHDGPPNECGPKIVCEDNVIGLCPENALDITSGDYHEFRRNICYMNSQPGIMVGHGSDNILIENNISFANKREGVKVGSNPAEGGRGHIRVIGNLFYDNGYPGIGVQAKATKVYNNTVVNTKNRAAIRLSDQAVDSEVINNLVVTLDPAIRQSSLQFMRGDPIAWNMKVANNMFFNAAKANGKVIHTKGGAFTPAEFVAKYGTGRNSLVAAPKFTSLTDRLFLLTADSPGVDMGADLGLPSVGRASDIGWHEMARQNGLPKYPPFLIGDGENDEAEILYMWGRSSVKPPDKDWTWPGAKQDSSKLLNEAERHAAAGAYPAAATGYCAAGYFGAGSAAGDRAQARLATLLAKSEVRAALVRAELDDAIEKAEGYCKRKPGLAIHFIELAQALAAGDAAALKRIEPMHKEVLAKLESRARKARK